MHEFTPTFIANKGWPTTHFDMDAVEAVGLVKMDILAQGGLAVMRDAKQSLRERGVEIDLKNCTGAICPGPSPSSLKLDGKTEDEGEGRGREEAFDDPAVWDMIASGNARAVHHIESPAMTSLCSMSNVREIDGLIAIVSVIRPGAANEQKKLKFTRRYQKMEPPEYPHPSLETCLHNTFGLVVYEEHILQICEAFAGLNPGRADVLRRALVKQKRKDVAVIAGEFAAAALARGHAPEKIREVWELVTSFNGYAFCKAHSTAYGVEAYQAAWLKLNFPAEFMAAVLTNGKGFYDPLVYVLECHRLGLQFLPPSVNQPGPEFKAEGRRQKEEQDAAAPPEMVSAFGLRPSAFIRVPATRAKGLTQRTTECWLAERERRPFISLADFHRRVAPQREELEILIRLGAFDEFDHPRTAQFWEAQLLNKAECRLHNA
jgi:DNA polymerase III alpha subunit